VPPYFITVSCSTGKPVLSNLTEEKQEGKLLVNFWKSLKYFRLYYNLNVTLLINFNIICQNFVNKHLDKKIEAYKEGEKEGRKR